MAHRKGQHFHFLTKLARENQEACKREIRVALDVCGGNTYSAAEKLDISRNFLWYLLKKLDMRREPREYRIRAKNRFRLSPNAA